MGGRKVGLREPEVIKPNVSLWEWWTVVPSSGIMYGTIVAVLALGLVAPAWSLPRRANVQVSNSQSSLTFVFQNNLNASDDNNHVGAILLDPMPAQQAASACEALSESLLAQATIQNYTNDFTEALTYVQWKYNIGPVFQVNNAIMSLNNSILSFGAMSSAGSLPVLCSQSSNASQPPNSTATADNTISVAAAGNTYVGYRNQKSFRFLGIRYANPPARFAYSTLYSKTGLTVNATAYGSQCLQVGSGGSEDCLFLNIQTPYIPKAGSTQNLRPVYFWIHGGGFTGGTGADPGTDGGNLASREDIVVVQTNYRLSTLGFLAIPGTNIKGNMGIGDQINALTWVKNNIAKFGGDPNHITIGGSSAGAGSVRALLGSPPAIGLFQGAHADSNLGGGKDLGLGPLGNYGTTYSEYLTIQQAFDRSWPNVTNATNCSTTNIQSGLACLRKVNATVLQNYNTAPFRYVVQDGRIVNTPQLDVTKRNGSSAYVPIMFGVAANDGASFSTLSKTPVKNLTQGLMTGLSISQHYAQAIIDSGLFPYHNTTGNLTLDAFNVTQRVATDNTFRCIDQATVYAGAVTGTFPAAYYYQFERSISGYNPNNLSPNLTNGPNSTAYPLGNPTDPNSYYHLHGSTGPWYFGDFSGPLRDDTDLYSLQLLTGYFAQFIRSGQPNPSVEYLTIRGSSYEKALQAIQATGPWGKVAGEDGPIKLLDYPARSSDFIDKKQCTFLNYTLGYYLNQ
jgi:carboxylesterase type B